MDTAVMGLTSSDGVTVDRKLTALRDPAHPFFRHAILPEGFQVPGDVRSRDT